MTSQRHICFFTGKRGGFTHFIPIIELVKTDPTLSYSVVACDMHLMDVFGKTISEVNRWANSVYHLETAMGSDSKQARAKSIGIGIMGISEILAQIQPDLVFVLGDRGEVLGMALCAVEMNIPVVHLFGGDICQGGVDEPVRHAITKLANLHLTSNKDSAERIRKMGEEPWRVHMVGSPALDLIVNQQFTPKEFIREKLDLDLGKPILVLLQHSVTWQVEEAENQIRETMQALDKLQYQTVAIYPCSDPGYLSIISVLEEYQSRPYLRLCRNLDFQDFWGLLSIGDVFIGNSSAGVMEAPSFNLPFVNVGIRQQDRLRAENVIDSGHNHDEIIAAINKALFEDHFKSKIRRCESPYGNGNASARILDILKTLVIDEKLIRKRLV